MPGRSTHHTITVAVNTIAEAELETKPLQTVAIDLESAFDTMEPLIAKEAMHAIGFHEEPTSIMSSQRGVKLIYKSMEY